MTQLQYHELFAGQQADAQSDHTTWTSGEGYVWVTGGLDAGQLDIEISCDGGNNWIVLEENMDAPSFTKIELPSGALVRANLHNTSADAANLSVRICI